jgi:hypothetical protein
MVGRLCMTTARFPTVEIMTSSPTTTAADLAADMRQFIIDQAGGRTPDTLERYVQVADDLAAFMDSVDVGPWLGVEIAAHLAAERQRIGPDAFLATLGLASLIRVLPAFAADPWLPPVGPRRRTHRTAIRRLTTFLRLRATQQGCFYRHDFARIDKALGSAYAHDHGRPVRRGDKVTCTVTVELLDRLVDALLEQVTRGEHESLDEAVAARLNPVQVTYWEEPDQRLPHGW